MVCEWPRISLREANIELIDCDHRTPPASDAGYPYVAIPQLSHGHIELSEARRIKLEHYVQWTRKAKPKAYDVILSRRCNPGETAVVEPGMEFALGQNLVLLRADGTRVYPPFLRWLVRGPQWWEQVSRLLNVGAVFDSLKCAEIPNFQLQIPPLPEQHAIAYILGTLDDKIELNKQMNSTLEAIGQALFKHWFIDFEFPNEEGKPYKSSGGEMVETELGKLPKGWRVETIGDLVTVKGGSTPSTENKEYWQQGTIPWCTPKDLSKLTSPVLLDTERKITESGLKNISSGLLPAGTLLLSSRAPIGYLAISEIPISINQGFIAISCDYGVSNYYMLYWIKSNLETIKSMANGSTFQEINKTSFKKIKIVAPARTILQAYNSIMKNIYGKIAENEKQIVVLTTICDTFLPKLMSGEIRVK